MDSASPLWDTLPCQEKISFRTVKQWLADFERQLRSQRPIIIAQKGSFHGKTTGSLTVTENPFYRTPFGLDSDYVVFVKRNDADELSNVFDRALRTIPIPLLNTDNQIVLSPLEICAVSACFLEPIQGEGGIKPLAGSYLRHCRELTQQHRAPLVIDEIQCGMGRTGSFLCATHSDITPDYLLLSKSLGAGIAKISAMLIEQGQYIEDFGLLHTSTFAEDDFSCAIALEALAVIDDDGLAERAKSTGRRLMASLIDLVHEFPDVLCKASGKGLMLGLKFRSMVDNGSSSIRLLARGELLGYVISGYLFHLHRIRVAPSLSNGSVIRIEPSAYIGDVQCSKLIDGLRDVCNVLRKQQSHLLLQYIVNRREANISALHKDYREVNRPIPPETTSHKKIGFIGHFIDHRDIALWDPAFENFSAEEQKAFLDKVYSILSPDHTDEIDIESLNGEKVRLIFSGICATSQHFDTAWRSRHIAPLRGKVQQAVDMLTEMGCQIIGLGAYTSIITKNCEMLRQRGTALTSGNSLTVGIGLEALKSAAEDLGINWSDARFSVIGATGNIASTYSALAAESVASINLIGRSETALKRLQRLANKIYADALNTLLLPEDVAFPTGISRQLIGTGLLNAARSRPAELGVIDWYSLAIEEMGTAAPVLISADLKSVSLSNAVLCASNASYPVLLASHLGPHPTAICDISIPSDVHPSIYEQRKETVKVVKGGNVKIMTNPNFRLKGCANAPGQVFACMAETILLGLTGIGGHYTYGPVVKRNVCKIMELSRFHGFTLSSKICLS